MEHIADRFLKCFNKNFKTPPIHQALSSLKVTKVDPEDWILDSGASSHMTSNLLQFTSIHVYHGVDSVMVGNDISLPITHIRNVSIHTQFGELCLQNVLLLPTLQQNLLSISQLTFELPYQIEFTDIEFLICYIDSPDN